MKIFRLSIFLICIAFLLYYGLSIFKNFRDLKQKAIRFPNKKEFYKNILHKNYSLVPSYLYTSNQYVSPIQSYRYKDDFDVLIFPIKQISPKKKSLPDQVNFIKNTNHQLLIKKSIYDGSFKNENVRFFTLREELGQGEKLKILYDGVVTTKPKIKNELVSYSLYVNRLDVLLDSSEKTPLFYVTDRNFLRSIKLSIEITFFRNENNLYVMLFLPKKNNIITEHPSLIYSIKL